MNDERNNMPTAAQLLDREGEPCKSLACNYEEPHDHGPACGQACACGLSMQRNPVNPYHDPRLVDDSRITDVPEIRPEVVTLCGSTRFRAEFDAADEQLTLSGFIVLRPGVWGHSKPVALDPAAKAELDRLHLAKIDMSDRVVVICPDRYIGESTLREIMHATKVGKVIEYREAKQVRHPQILRDGGPVGPGMAGPGSPGGGFAGSGVVINTVRGTLPPSEELAVRTLAQRNRERER